MTKTPFPTGILLTMDSASIAAAMTVAYYFRVEGAVLPYYGPQDVFGYIRTAVIVLPLWIAIHFAARLYDADIVASGSEEYAKIAKASAFGVVLLTTLSFWDRTVILSRGWILISWAISLFLMISGRVCLRSLLLRRRRRGQYRSRALIIGVNQRALAIARQFTRDVSTGIAVAAFLDDNLAPGAEVLDGICVWGSPTQLSEAIVALNVDEVFIVSEALDWETAQEVMHEAAALPDHIRARLCPKLDELWTAGVKLGETAEVAVLTFAGMRITGRDAVVKRLLDCTLSSFFLLLATPLWLTIAGLLCFVDRVPVLDRYRVHGRNGKSFDALKFHTGLLGTTHRTLSRSNPVVDLGRPGSKSLGRFLYRTGLDKVPQLLNVVAGQMSLVGPRTISVEDALFRDRWRAELSVLRPGMTGPWALSQPANLEEEMESTLYYARKWGLRRDIRILVQTAVAIFLAKGAVSEGYSSPACSVDEAKSLSASA